MKTFNTGSVFKLLAGFTLLGLILHSQTFAVGTSQGTSVSNQATITYSVGSELQTAIQSDDPYLPGNNDATVFLVDELIDMTITATTVAHEVIGNVVEIAEITVLNTGNGAQDFVLGYEDHTSSDNFDLDSVQFFEDTNGNGIYNSGTDLLITTGFITLPEVTGTPTPADNVTVFALATMPGTATNGQISNIHWTLQASNGASVLGSDDSPYDQGTVQIVFADGENTDLATNTGTTDATEDGLVSSDTVTYTIEGLIVTKSVAPTANPSGITGDPRAVPGATMTYTISIQNTGAPGTGNATDLTIADTIDDTNLDTTASFPAALSGCAGVPNDTSADDTLNISGITVVGGTTCTVTFDAIIR